MNHKLITDTITKDDGFTLVEIMIALSISAIIMTALFLLFGKTVDSTVHAKNITEANALMSSQIELLKGIPIDAANIASGDIALMQIPNSNLWLKRVSIADPVHTVFEFRIYERAVDGDGTYTGVFGDRPLVSRTFIKVADERISLP